MIGNLDGIFEYLESGICVRMDFKLVCGMTSLYHSELVNANY